MVIKQWAKKEKKGGLNTKIHLAVDANGMPIRVIVIEGKRY